MTNPGATLVFPASVREQVLDQHRELRGSMQGLLDHCDRDLRGEGVDRERLTEMVRDLHGAFRSHLEFEEQALGPVLAVLDHWGPERLRAMQEEHRRQRADLAALIQEVEGGVAIERLVLVARELVTDLLHDMDDEEDGCLRPTLLGAAFLEIERR